MGIIRYVSYAHLSILSGMSAGGIERAFFFVWKSDRKKNQNVSAVKKVPHNTNSIKIAKRAKALFIDSFSKKCSHQYNHIKFY
jgi:hypothetical protein